MANMSDFLEVKIGKVLLGSDAAYKPAAIYVGLWTTTLSDASTGSSGTEASGGSYARTAIPQADAQWNIPTTTGLFDNVNAVTFPTATADWGIVTHFALCDASTAGNILFWAALTASRDVKNGDTFRFSGGALDITFA